jgi:hypothetical protein
MSAPYARHKLVLGSSFSRPNGFGETTDPVPPSKETAADAPGAGRSPAKRLNGTRICRHARVASQVSFIYSARITTRPFGNTLTFRGPVQQIPP